MCAPTAPRRLFAYSAHNVPGARNSCVRTSAITKQACEGYGRVSQQGADRPKRPRFLFSPELTLKAEGSSKGILRKTKNLLTYLFLLMSLPSISQPFTVTIITQKTRERTGSSFFFQSFFTHQSTTGREY